MKLIGSILIMVAVFTLSTSHAQNKPLRLGVIGLTHTHVHWILGRPADNKVVIAGIVESNTELARRYMQQHGLPMHLLYATMEELIEKEKPDAVAAFGSIEEHLKVVEKFAPLGIHVMVEKPLAINMEHGWHCRFR
jgi:predicted dehydrogenase